jgi:ABC-type Fe3+ transport system permease subunit
MQTPGKTPAIVLAAIGVLTFAFPVICLPTSITAIVLATKAIRWEKDKGVRDSTLLQVVRVASVLAICATVIAMASAFPAAWERNFG